MPNLTSHRPTPVQTPKSKKEVPTGLSDWSTVNNLTHHATYHEKKKAEDITHDEHIKGLQNALEGFNK